MFPGVLGFSLIDRENKDVFVWKNSIRLKVNDGTSAGCVASIETVNANDGIVKVSMVL